MHIDEVIDQLRNYRLSAGERPEVRPQGIGCKPSSADRREDHQRTGDCRGHNRCFCTN